MTTEQRIQQQKREEFVSREIYANQTTLVEEMFRTKTLTVDEIYNLYREFDGLLLSPSICEECKEKAICLDSDTGLCESCYNDQNKPQQVYEWWLVSPWLGKKLILEGVPVIASSYSTWWGRITTGQCLVNDDIIEEIYRSIYGSESIKTYK